METSGKRSRFQNILSTYTNSVLVPSVFILEMGNQAQHAQVTCSVLWEQKVEGLNLCLLPWDTAASGYFYGHFKHLWAVFASLQYMLQRVLWFFMWMIFIHPWIIKLLLVSRLTRSCMEAGDGMGFREMRKLSVNGFYYAAENESLSKMQSCLDWKILHVCSWMLFAHNGQTSWSMGRKSIQGTRNSWADPFLWTLCVCVRSLYLPSGSRKINLLTHVLNGNCRSVFSFTWRPCFGVAIHKSYWF